MAKVSVYPFECSAEELSRRCSDLLKPPLTHWAASPALLTLGSGLPSAWLGQGAVFNLTGEIRWWQEEQGYQAVLLSDQPVPGLVSDEEWEAQEETVLLQDLNESRVSPGFSQYPHGSADGRLRVQIYRRQGVPHMISLREWKD